MKILHWLREVSSGMEATTYELASAERELGHEVQVRDPHDGRVLQGPAEITPDVHCVHSQIPPELLFDEAPKFAWMHAEPLYSMGMGAMEAILGFATRIDAFICMRAEELPIWRALKRPCYLVPKGIDLDKFKPAEPAEKLPGEPAVLYYENQRAERNPLYWMAAMEQVWRANPDARLHIFNNRDEARLQLLLGIIRAAGWECFMGTVGPHVPDVPALINSVDIVVSSIYPLYARSIEALGCGKPLVCPGYREHEDYPYRCDLEAGSMAAALDRAWIDKVWSETPSGADSGKLDPRAWAEKHHDVMETARQACEIYQRHLR